ncbi:glycan biosynthesis hexose transferase WsfD [Actinomycetospora flava]|uniref:Dolichyl-phosphate-mannose-protein mannosyltransferase n=1 Tax=Actinomycetospora flava TaxID=3129232 RepID=A0ABU8M456_9PSEU
MTTGVGAEAHRAPTGWHRVTLAAGATVLAASVVVFTLGLPTGRPVGVEDNGDGFRLYCGLGLVPRTVDRLAAWKGGVVTDFAVGAPICGSSTPSSATLVLHAAVLGHDGSFALATLGWWYAVLAGVVVGVAAWAASAGGLRRAAVLVVPVAPLALVPFTRLFVSTYAEPAGLLGALALACGIAAVMVTGRADRRARTVALALVAVGGAVAATAKPAYVPVLVAAVVVCAVVRVGRRRPWRVVGPAIAVVTVLAAAGPIGAAVNFQNEIYEGANVHDIVFTLALTELGPTATAELGLPPEAAALTGDGYFNAPPRATEDWWVRAVRDEPDATRAAAYAALARDPAALLRAVGVGLQATLGADLPYLAAGPGDVARPSPPGGDPGWSGAHQPDLHSVLGSFRAPWLPSALVLLALGAAASTVAWRRRAPACARWCLAAGLGAATAVGLVVAAVLGDGYFEVFKHVWLAAYLLVLTGLCLLGALAHLALSGRRR